MVPHDVLGYDLEIVGAEIHPPIRRINLSVSSIRRGLIREEELETVNAQGRIIQRKERPAPVELAGGVHPVSLQGYSSQ